MLRTSGASSGPSTEWMQQRDQSPMPNAHQEVPHLGEALSKHTSHLGTRTAGELQHLGHGAPQGGTSGQENLQDEGWGGQAGGSVGSEAGLGTLGMWEEDRGQGCGKAAECQRGRQAAPVVTFQLLCAESVTGRRHSPAEKCGEPGVIRACGPSSPLPSIQPGTGGTRRTFMSSPYPGQLLPPGPAPPEEGAPKR